MFSAPEGHPKAARQECHGSVMSAVLGEKYTDHPAKKKDKRSVAGYNMDAYNNPLV